MDSKHFYEFYEIYRVLMISNQAIMTVIYSLVVLSECILYIDMHLLLKYPFYPREKRYIYYYVTFFMVSILSFFHIFGYSN